MMTSTTLARPFSGAGDIRKTVRRETLLTLWRMLVSLAARVAAAYDRHRSMSRAIAELSALSDRSLKDIGVQRHDIDRLVRDRRDAGARR